MYLEKWLFRNCRDILGTANDENVLTALFLLKKTQHTIAMDAYFMEEERAYREGTGYYAKNTAVNVMTHGKIYVEVADGADVADKKAAYVVLSGADKGKFTDEASGNYDTGCVFCSAEQNGLALIEVNGLK